MKKTITGILCIMLVLLLSGCSMLDYALKGVDEVTGINEDSDTTTDSGIEWTGEDYFVYSLNSNQNPDKSIETTILRIFPFYTRMRGGSCHPHMI